MIKNLTRKVNAPQKVCTHAAFKTMLTATNGVFMSTVTYLLPVWGGYEGYLHQIFILFIKHFLGTWFIGPSEDLDSALRYKLRT